MVGATGPTPHPPMPPLDCMRCRRPPRDGVERDFRISVIHPDMHVLTFTGHLCEDCEHALKRLAQQSLDIARAAGRPARNY